MRACRYLVAAALLAPCTAAAQTSTADGVQALIHGDYATAARILHPLAENAQPDPLALFFMATLYHSGRGVAMNQIRACGLYLRAATIASPISRQALALAHTIYMDVPVLQRECSEASLGVWGEPAAVSFTIGLDHWVQIDQAGFVVYDKGVRKATAMTMGGVGWVFLPTRHTQLEVSRPSAMRRDFIEFFFWVPDVSADQTTWALVWSVIEVSGVETRPVLQVGVLVATDAAEPTGTAAMDDVVRLQVNAEGEAEWIVTGANRRSGVIPPQGSR